ncbi:hypothetical protein BJ742DRAFT_503250 [Cladochytrium replicatum]|nr:hypothetical protein BJ742DRAFT_503250 [Cladochytrium replicatum]
MVAESNHSESAAGDVGPPSQPVPKTSVIASTVDLDTALAPSMEPTHQRAERRSVEGFEPVFLVDPLAGCKDASINGIAYLTYRVIPNNTYNVEACLQFCDSEPKCVFANIFYEFNNYGLDVLNSEKSNLKCAIYGDVHTAVEKTNFGGQQSYPEPHDKTCITHSTGWQRKDLRTFKNPATPWGYALTFGPLTAANIAPGIINTILLSQYDIQACADLCSSTADSKGRSCVYFNIWRAIENGVPKSYTCSLYYYMTNSTTATFTGKDAIAVTYSRGYHLLPSASSLLTDGGFESLSCTTFFCFSIESTAWQGSGQGINGASVFSYKPFARSGFGLGILGSATYNDSLPGTLSTRTITGTQPGKQYVVRFWTDSTFSGAVDEIGAWIQVVWNGDLVERPIVMDFQPWVMRSVVVSANGQDVLGFVGGKAPAWVFVDDVEVIPI